MLNQSTHSSVAYSMSSLRRQGPRRQIYLRLEQSDHQLGERVVTGVAAAAHRGCDPRPGQPLGVADRQVLRAAVAAIDQAVEIARPVIESLLQSVEGRVRTQRVRQAPADDAPREQIYDEHRADKAAPGGDIGQVRNPELVGARGAEVSRREVERPFRDTRRRGGDAEGWLRTAPRKPKRRMIRSTVQLRHPNPVSEIQLPPHLGRPYTWNFSSRGCG